jgi:4-hydroxyacetophenone monooxygenase
MTTLVHRFQEWETATMETGLTKTAATGIDLQEALADADRRTMAAVLTHLTGDVNLIPDVRDREHIMAMAERVLPSFLKGERIAPPPTDVVLQAAMALAAGGPIPVSGKYAPFVREQMGIGPVVPPEPIEPPAPLSIVIIGAGVTGLGLATYLDNVGLHDYTILERHPSVGGTWWLNRYPGCRVDTPSLLYSYSFNMDPGWPNHFSHQPALLEYMHETAGRVKGEIRTGVAVESLEWIESQSKWRVIFRPAGGQAEEMLFDVVLGATGFLSSPRFPDIAGTDSFRGSTFHSGDWDDSVDLAGKRVAVIGTGASANQIVPAIADVAAQIVVYQRTPHWITPHPYYGKPLTGGQRYLIEQVPSYLEWFRFRQFWVVGDGAMPLMRIDPEWPDQEHSINADNDVLRAMLTTYIEEQLSDRPDLVDKVVPNYPPYAKRMVLDNGWYSTLKRPNVSLVTEPITKIVERGVVTTGGTTDVDVIVYATGFHTNRVLAPMQITGRGGVDMREQLDKRPEAYFGIALKDCPNLFMTSGPNGVPVHGGAGTLLAEIECSFIVQCLRAMVDANASSIEVKPSTLRKFSEAAAAENAKYIWSTSGVTNWYAFSGAGAAVVFPWSLYDFWSQAKNPDLNAFTYGTKNQSSDEVSEGGERVVVNPSWVSHTRAAGVGDIR